LAGYRLTRGPAGPGAGEPAAYAGRRVAGTGTRSSGRAWMAPGAGPAMPAPAQWRPTR